MIAIVWLRNPITSRQRALLHAPRGPFRASKASDKGSPLTGQARMQGLALRRANTPQGASRSIDQRVHVCMASHALFPLDDVDGSLV